MQRYRKLLNLANNYYFFCNMLTIFATLIGVVKNKREVKEEFL